MINSSHKYPKFQTHPRENEQIFSICMFACITLNMRPEVIKLSQGSIQLSWKIVLLLHMKMPTFWWIEYLRAQRASRSALLSRKTV